MTRRRPDSDFVASYGRDPVMAEWLKKWWPVLIVCGMFIAILDSTFSTLLTCHPIGGQTRQSADTQHNQECTALHGPVLLTLVAIVEFFDEHGDAIVATFTIVLAVFTARLWVSTEKLWDATRATAEAQRRDTEILQRAYIAVDSGGVDPFGAFGEEINTVAHIGVKNAVLGSKLT